MSDSEIKEPSTPATPASTTAVTFTDREQRVLANLLSCMKSVPEVDLKKLTQLAGFNTEKTCSNVWSIIKKKMQTNAAADGMTLTDDTPGKGKKSTTPKKRGKGANTDSDGDGGVDTPETPVKKARKAPAKGKGKGRKEESAIKEEVSPDIKDELDEGEQSEAAIAGA